MAAPLIAVRTTGGPELAAALRGLGTIALVARTIQAAQKKSLRPTVARAWELAPKLRGDMAESIAARSVGKSRGGARGFETTAVGPSRDRFYGTFHEFGTVKMAAKPFLRPAWDTTRETVLKLHGVELWAAIARTAKRLARKRRKGK